MLMIVIPFFDDQNFLAYAVEKKGYGKAFLHEKESLPKVMALLSGLYERKSLNELSLLEEAIESF